ncbi:MAG TPA: copper chaperone PCu(A)C [Jatrophihabitantaceae bacterium]
MRMPWPVVVGGVALAVVGAAGLIWGAVPVRSGGGGTNNVDPIVVTNAYVRPPAPPTKTAAAYFTIYNTTGTPDRLLSVTTGAGAESVLHTAGMKPAPDGIVVPAHGKLVLSTGDGHVMIEQLFGPLLPGETVNMNLQFENAGVVPVTAKVIALGAPVPTGGS